MSRELGELDRLFRALADATRLRILGLLLTGEVCVCHIHESLRIPQPKASRHLAYLRRAKLVETRRDGLWVYYRLAASAEPVVRIVQQAVANGLRHVDAVQRDADRLREKTGCCLPVVGEWQAQGTRVGRPEGRSRQPGGSARPKERALQRTSPSSTFR